jgi:hypothetical protein
MLTDSQANSIFQIANQSAEDTFNKFRTEEPFFWGSTSGFLYIADIIELLYSLGEIGYVRALLRTILDALDCAWITSEKSLYLDCYIHQTDEIPKDKVDSWTIVRNRFFEVKENLSKDSEYFSECFEKIDSIATTSQLLTNLAEHEDVPF